ncbi:ferritin, heavy subunit-like [Sapajus apella]|uniref:Ferritin n=1 Tax=Sapajus apella TaxID=9515 RepID=A0A6J3JM29_SAPAP|nr:ferritin, heavy subunit-like [Sapajus apella]
MEHKAHVPISEECKVAINRVAAYELLASDVYLSMACYYTEDTGIPPFAKFFSEQAEMKREHAKRFLRYLRKRESMICLPVIKRPDIDNWGSGLQALKCAVQLENILTDVLQDLKTTASKDEETELVNIVMEFLHKQGVSIAFLEHQQKIVEEFLQQKGPSEKSAKTTGEET